MPYVNLTRNHCRPLRALGVLAWILIGLSGCGTSGDPSTATDEFVELEFPEDPVDLPASETPVSRRGMLVPGETMTFHRHVEQNLEQQVEDRRVVSSSKLKVEYTITFEGLSIPPEFEGKPTRPDLDANLPSHRTIPPETTPVPQFRVRFHNAEQQLELPGQPVVTIDSTHAAGDGESPQVGLHGLRDNGFRFWLSDRGEPLALDDFPAFLDRCAQSVPEGATRIRFRRALESAWGSDGPTQFLTDMLGLISVRGNRPGERWVETRTISHPTSIRQSTEFVLGATRDENRTLEWRSRLNPVDAKGTAGDSDVVIRFIGGDATGTSSLDPRTGLTIASRQTQHLQMRVRTAGGRDFPQTKTTVIRIERQPDPLREPQVATENGAISGNLGTSPLRISDRGRRVGR